MTNHFVGDTAVLLGRSLRHITRSLDTIITTTIMPIAFMLLFVYVFGGAINSGSDSYVNYLLPGILLITIASGISYTAFRLFLDMKSGIFERFQSMPIARSSVLWAHVLTSLVANLISIVVVVLVALLMGFRSGAGVLGVARGRRHPDRVHPGVDVDRRDSRSLREVRGRRERVRLPAHLPAVHQLGIRAHPDHARPGARLRRAPAGDVHRQRGPRPVRAAAGRHRHLDRPWLVCRHPHRRLWLRHGHLPPQDLFVERRGAVLPRASAWSTTWETAHTRRDERTDLTPKADVLPPSFERSCRSSVNCARRLQTTGGASRSSSTTARPCPALIHRDHDEIFYVLAGRFSFTLDQSNRVAEAGALVWVPRGTRHGFTIEPRSKALLITQPSGLEGFFVELGRVSPRNVQR